MTDQSTDFERELADRLRTRADRTRVDLDHDRIVSGRFRRRAGRAAQPLWLVPIVVVAAAVLVVGGLAILGGDQGERPAPADTLATLPTVPPAPVDYGVLDDTEGPTIDDHWHVAYGFNLCGEWSQLEGNLEGVGPDGELLSDGYALTGLHSHDDGVIHIHPFTALGTGAKVTLGRFLSLYRVEVTDNKISFSNGQLMNLLSCDMLGKQLVVVVWPDANDPTDRIILTSGFAGIPLRDGAAITITDDLANVTPPPSASALDVLGAVDAGQVAPEQP
jgi:hypothetical protein